MASNGHFAAKPAHFSLTKIIRPNILQLTPYRCARDDYSTGILLDANENALGPSFASSSSTDLDDLDLDSLALHRYPDPNQIEIKKRIAELRNLTGGPENVFLGVGSDEVIDLLFRIVCSPGKDSVLGECMRTSALPSTRFAQRMYIAHVKVMPPTYGMYSVCAAVNDVNIVKINLDVEKGRFQPKVDEVNPTCP
jgi:histidinol-phosphate aminotransferase